MTRSRHVSADKLTATPATQVESALRRYLLYGLLPAWFIPGVADWVMHRKTHIERTSGIRESLIHSLMMAEVGAPIVAALLLRINRTVLAGMAVAAAAHEATAMWDVRVAYDSPREVRPAEQHWHAFLESLPWTALAAVACLHWDEIVGDQRGRRFELKRPPLSRRYVGGIGAAIAAFVAAPYGEELLRCLRAERDLLADGGAA
jgi:hypothetical protein